MLWCERKQTMLNQETLRAYRQRWETVAQIENTERQTMGVVDRWQKLNALLNMSIALGLESIDNELQTDSVQRNWNCLYQAYLIEQQEKLA
jgi:hypothetical protein